MSKRVNILRKWVSILIVLSLVLSVCNTVAFAAQTAEAVIAAEKGDMLWVKYTNHKKTIANEEKETGNYWRVVAGDYVNGDWSKIIIAKFDITNLTYDNIKEAYISFGGSCNTAGANYDIREITSDWSSATVSAGTSPTISTSSIATFTSTTGESTYKIDLTDYVAQLKADNKTKLNIAITGNGTDFFIRQTDDGALLYPRLYITSTDAAAPTVNINAPSYVQENSSLNISAEVVDNSDDLTVDFYVDDVKFEGKITNTGSNYSVTLADGLTLGDHSIKVTAENSNGMSRTVTKNIESVADINATTSDSVSFITKNCDVNYIFDRHWHIYNDVENNKSCIWLMYADLSKYADKPISEASLDISVCSLKGSNPVFGIHEITDSAKWYTEAGNQISNLPIYSATPVMQFTNSADNTWRRISIDLTDYINSLTDKGITELNIAFTVDNDSNVNTYITMNDTDNEARKAPKFNITSKNYGEKPKVSAVSEDKYYIDNKAFDFDVSITGEMITEIKAFIDETEITCENIDNNTYRCEIPALDKGEHILKVTAKNIYDITTTFKYDLYCGKYMVTQQSFTDVSGEEFVFASGNTIKNNLKLIN